MKRVQAPVARIRQLIDRAEYESQKREGLEALRRRRLAEGGDGCENGGGGVAQDRQKRASDDETIIRESSAAAGGDDTDNDDGNDGGEASALEPPTVGSGAAMGGAAAGGDAGEAGGHAASTLPSLRSSAGLPAARPALPPIGATNSSLLSVIEVVEEDGLGVGSSTSSSTFSSTSSSKSAHWAFGKKAAHAPSAARLVPTLPGARAATQEPSAERAALEMFAPTRRASLPSAIVDESLALVSTWRPAPARPSASPTALPPPSTWRTAPSLPSRPSEGRDMNLT